MAGDGAHPVVEAVEVGIAVWSKPLLCPDFSADQFLPKQPPQGVGFARQAPAQRLEQVGALALKCLRELAEVMQRQPEGDPAIEPGLIAQGLCEQLPLRWRAPKVFNPHRRHIQTVIDQRMPLGLAGIVGIGLAPIVIEIKRLCHGVLYLSGQDMY